MRGGMMGWRIIGIAKSSEVVWYLKHMEVYIMEHVPPRCWGHIIPTIKLKTSVQQFSNIEHLLPYENRISS